MRRDLPAPSNESPQEETPRTVIVARGRATTFEEKRYYTRALLGWNDGIVAGQVADSTRKQYTEDFFDYLRFARNAQYALDSAIFSAVMASFFVWRVRLAV